MTVNFKNHIVDFKSGLCRSAALGNTSDKQTVACIFDTDSDKRSACHVS